MMLRSRDPQKISQMIRRLKKEAENIIRDLVEITWFMRGGIQYFDAYELVPQERDAIKDFIKENLENQKKSPNPQF